MKTQNTPCTRDSRRHKKLLSTHRPLLMGAVAAAALAAAGSFIFAPKPSAQESRGASQDDHVVSCLTPAIADPAEGLRPRTTNVSEVVFPVYFHIIHAGPSLEEGNVPDAVIHLQMEILNDACAGGQGGASTPFRFQLVAIQRILNPDWFTDPYLYEARAALRVGGASVLNIFVNRGGGSFATFPWEYKWHRDWDGVVLHFKVLPGMNIGLERTGDTLVHEVGHWLGVFHTFAMGCPTPECVGWQKKWSYVVCDDMVDDTPAHTVPPPGLLPPPDLICAPSDSCPDQPGLDPMFNFMNYTDDSCRSEFTPGQVARMIEKYSIYRENR